MSGIVNNQNPQARLKQIKQWVKQYINLARTASKTHTERLDGENPDILKVLGFVTEEPEDSRENLGKMKEINENVGKYTGIIEALGDAYCAISDLISVTTNKYKNK